MCPIKKSQEVESHIFQFFFFHKRQESYRTWLIKNNCYVSIPDLAAFQWWVKLFSYVFQICISVLLKDWGNVMDERCPGDISQEMHIDCRES